MISSDKHRTSINITIADIFADYNDSRKQMLMKRVKIAMEDLEIRMRNEVQGNNLANLQMLLKKQQALKKMQQKMEEMSHQLQQKRERDNYLTNKLSELQAEVAKSSQFQRHLQQKMKKMYQTIHQKDLQLSQREATIASLQKQLQEINIQNQQLQMERSKLETNLKRMRETYQHKTYQTEMMIKIKQKRMEESMNQSINNIQIRHQREKEKRQVQAKLKSPKIDKKNQRIQVSIANSPSPQPIVTRRESQMTTRQPVRNVVDREVQTIPTQQTKIVQLIDNTPSKTAEKLQEIRLVYAATPKFTPQVSPPISEQPKITKIYTVQTLSTRVQTDPVIFKPPTPVRMQQNCQVFVEEDRSFMQYMIRQIEILKEKYVKMQQFHDGRYWQLLKIYENRPSQEHDLQEIQKLKVSLFETQLQLTKKEKQLAEQRDLYVKAKNELYESQNNLLLRRLTVKLGEQALSKKPKMNQTCSFFYNNSSKRVHTQLSHNYQELENEENNLIQTNQTIRIKRPTEEDIITVTKSKNSLKFRRHSLKTSMVVMDGYESRRKIGRQYQKYSKSKNKGQ